MHGTSRPVTLRARRRAPIAVQLELEFHNRHLHHLAQRLLAYHRGDRTWPRGMPEGLEVVTRRRWTVDWGDFLFAQAALLLRHEERWRRIENSLGIVSAPLE